MSVIYCEKCGCKIDTDYDTNHDADCLGKEVSKCCGADVIVKGKTTNYYECSSCKQPTDIY